MAASGLAGSGAGSVGADPSAVTAAVAALLSAAVALRIRAMYRRSPPWSTTFGPVLLRRQCDVHCGFAVGCIENQIGNRPGAREVIFLVGDQSEGFRRAANDHLLHLGSHGAPRFGL